MQKRFIAFSGFSGAIAITLGAMCAHFLRSKADEGLLSERAFQAFETGVRYQVYHTLALLLLSVLITQSNNKLFIKAGYCFMAGIVLFSGSLYLLSTGSLSGMGNLSWLGPVTPIGGLFFIAGWILTGIAGLNKKN
jgi:uncharacterized membrane protein YgdD (TMEM256/DUF423 family)